MALEIQILTWDRHKTMAELKQLMGSPNYTRKLDIKHKQNRILSHYYLFFSQTLHHTPVNKRLFFIKISSKVNIYDMQYYTILVIKPFQIPRQHKNMIVYSISYLQ